MAKPSSAHSDSVAPRRKTRSQSAEPVEPARSTSRRGRPARKPPSASAPVRVVRKRGNQQKATPDLTTVEEDDDDAEDDEDQGRLAPATGIVRETEDSRRVSAAVSVISGTTAKTSFSQEEVELMDPDIIVDSLPSLAGAFDELARILVPTGKVTPPETWKEIRRPGSKHNKLYQNRLKSIEVHKANFGTQEYIQPRIVLKALFGAKDELEVLDAPWRPDDIILRINLIQMMNDLLVNIREPGERNANHVNALERLLIAYPETIAGRQYSISAMEMYANIAAHVAIAKLEASVNTDPNFSPHHVIDTVFFDEDDDFVHAAGLGLNETSDANRKHGYKIITDLVGALRSPFEDHRRSATAAIGQLKSLFRWDTFREHALRFYEGRTSQLAQRIAHNGGIDQILQHLEEEVERRAIEKEAKLMRQKYANPRSTQRRSLGSMAKLKEREKLIAHENASAHATEPSRETVPADTTTIPLDAPSQPVNGPAAVERELPVPLPTSTQATVTAGLAQALRKSQKARWLDPQPNATRIDPHMDDEIPASGREPTPSAQLPQEIPASSRTGKRARADEDDENEMPDPTQDEGFQTDVRDFSAADQRRREVQFVQTQRTQHRPQSTGASASYNHRSSAVPDSSPAKRQRKNPGSSMPAPLSAPRPEDNALVDRYERAKMLAKLNAVQGAYKKPVQQRRPWGQEEENRMIELIEENGGDGISYQYLKSIDAGSGDVLWKRTAEDLRFKARNMKVTMLRSSGSAAGLPINWEHVVLSKKEIDIVRRHGVDYEQERLRASALNFDE